MRSGTLQAAGWEPFVSRWVMRLRWKRWVAACRGRRRGQGPAPGSGGGELHAHLPSVALFKHLALGNVTTLVVNPPTDNVFRF